MCKVNIPDNLRERHRRIRAGFVLKGTTLQAWCIKNGVKRQNADKALLGQWNGPKARSVVQQIMADAGIAE